MAAATSAAISMEMRWMSAILYDKISPQKNVWVNQTGHQYPAGVAVREERRRDLSKNPCTLHRKRESPISLPLSRRHCKEKGNARYVSENLVKHSGNQVRDERRRDETSSWLFRLRRRRPMKSPRSRNFPRQMSHFHRLHGYVIPRHAVLADRLVKVSARIVISFRQSGRRGGVATNEKKVGKKEREMKLPFQSKQLRTR